jgi:tetratricopeptide (TPR) repeat protein
MGVVFRAIDLRIGRPVALKLLHESQPDQVKRFLREAEALARVQHPNVVSIHDLGHHRGVPYLVEELVEGQSLADLLEGEPLEEAEAIRLGLQLASALSAAHAVGVLHRDVKPSNVVLDQRGDAKLVDFGLARLDGRSRLTATGAFAGTIGFCPPEQLRSLPPTQSLDVYGLAATLYAMVTGEPPGGRAPLLALSTAVLGRIPSPRSLRPELSRGLERALLEALAADPQDRPPTVAAFADSLREARERPNPPRRLRALAVAGASLALVLSAVVARGALWGGVGSESGAPPVGVDVQSSEVPSDEERSQSTASALRTAPPLSLAAVQVLRREGAPAEEVIEHLQRLVATFQGQPRRQGAALEALAMTAVNRFQPRVARDAAAALSELPGREAEGAFLLYLSYAALGEQKLALRSMYRASRTEGSWGFLARSFYDGGERSSLPRRGSPLFLSFARYADAFWQRGPSSAGLDVLKQLTRSGPFVDSAPLRMLMALRSLDAAIEGDRSHLDDALGWVRKAADLTAPRTPANYGLITARLFLALDQPKAVLNLEASYEGPLAANPQAALGSQRGLALWRLGRSDEARDCWRAALDEHGTLILDLLDYTDDEEFEVVWQVALARGVVEEHPDELRLNGPNWLPPDTVSLSANDLAGPPSFR